MKQKRIVVLGCGVMGRRTIEALLEKKSLRLIGAVDVDEKILGNDVGELLEPQRAVGISVQRADEAPLADADCVIVTTGSRLASIEDQINACIDAGANVVSTCEELAYPWKRNAEVARRLDERARKKGVTVVGTGINPGYLMDTLPLVLTAPCLSVQRITVTRMMNSARRRLPFQKKVGTGLSPSQFREQIDSGAITGHVGLRESMQMVATGLGWEIAEFIEEPPKPVLADSPTETGFGTVAKGQVIGLSSVAHASDGETERIRLEFHAYAGVEEEYDEVVVEGVKTIRERIHGGVHGDVGTVALTINTAARAVDAGPGVLTMAEMPVVSAVP